ncbi:MAG: MFS transporter, partial [Streptosporangiaceae bacterium]
YLTLYLQEVLGYSPLAAGIRFLPVTMLAFVVAPFAGKAAIRIHARYLLGLGLFLVGVGCALASHVQATSSWTVLLPGFIVAGTGIGLTNPVLALATVSVVPPERSGMASGSSSTFRQVGIATGIALLGTLFSNKVHSEVVSRVTAVHGLSGRGSQIATAVQSGQIEHVLSKLPPQARQSVGMITRAAFTTGLDRILLVAAIIALASGVISLAAIRSKDFAHQGGGSQPAEAGASATPAAG